MSRLVDVALLFATADQWAGAVLLACALLLVHLGSRRGRAGVPVPPRAPHAASGFRRWLTPFGVPSLATLAPARRGTPILPAAQPVARRTPRPRPVVDAGAVTRLARAGSDAAEIARRTGLARDAVRLVLLRDGAPALSGAAMAAAMPATAATPRVPAGRESVTRDATLRDTTLRDATLRDATLRDIAASRRARAMPAIRDERDERAARDPRPLDERARAAESGRGTRFTAMVR
jgi:hypothetical protein